MKQSIKYEIIKYLELYPKGVFGGVIENYISGFCSTKGSTVSRRLRELADEKRIICEKKQIGGKGPHVNFYILQKREVSPQYRREEIKQLKLV